MNKCWQENEQRDREGAEVSHDKEEQSGQKVHSCPVKALQ